MYLAWIEFCFEALRGEKRRFESVRIRRKLTTLQPLGEMSIRTADQNLSLLRRGRPYPATRYFGIGEKHIIKFNGPSDTPAATAGEQPINTGNKATTNLKINRSPYFSTPFTSVNVPLALFRARGKGLALPFLHSSYELLGCRT